MISTPFEQRWLHCQKKCQVMLKNLLVALHGSWSIFLGYLRDSNKNIGMNMNMNMNLSVNMNICKFCT